MSLLPDWLEGGDGGRRGLDRCNILILESLGNE
jgi:hypothetical protein